MLVAIEGLDYAGKSSAMEAVQKMMPVHTYETPSSSFAEVRAIVDRYATPAEHCDFYRLAVQAASKEIEELLQQGNVLVCRYWMTTAAYHRADGVTVSKEDFGNIVMPDRTIYMRVSQQELLNRTQKRPMTEGDRRDFPNLDRVRVEYDRLLAEEPAGTVIDIDTTNLQLVEVCAEVVRQISILRK